MIIGLTTKPGLAAHLTGQSSKNPESQDKAVDSKAAAPSTDSVQLSTPSAATKLASKIAGMQSKIKEQEEFLSNYEFVPNQVLVRVKNEVASLSDFASEYGASLIEQIDLTGLKPSVASSEQLMLLDLKENLSVAEAMVVMSDDPRVSVVESNDIQKLFVEGPPKVTSSEPNDLNEKLWGLENTGQNGGTAGIDIGAKQAWETTIGSRTGPIVAVIDSGVDITHPDLKDNIFTNKGEVPNDGIDNDGNGVIDDINGYNAAEDTTDPKDDHGHGTHVAGTIGAVGNNGTGVVGVNQEAQILPIRFLDKDGLGTAAGAIKALVYATRTGARVVNNSWGGNKYNQVVFDTMLDSDSLFVCAAGNEAYDNDIRPVYPAGYALDNVISVTAHDRNNKFPKFANRGETTVELAAPGVEIESTLPRRKYGQMDGTSMASPHVAGAATLIATAHPEISNEDIKFLLMNNLEALPEQYGSRIISGGRLNIGHALEQDAVAPAKVGELKQNSVTSSSVSVSWTAPGDDGMEGKAAAYDVRYTLGQFSNGEGEEGIPFEDARSLKAGAPKDASSPESLSFRLSPSGKERNLTLGVVGVDNVRNKGELSTISVTIPAAKVALEDNGDSELETAFDPSTDWTRVAVPDRGMVFTESPDGNYPDDRNAMLVSKTFSLEDFDKPVLHFESKFDVEKKHDEFVVEVERDGWWGKKWKEVASFDGLSDWQAHQIDLRKYAGKDEVRVRFRLESDKDRNRDGVYLDNIVIAEAKE